MHIVLGNLVILHFQITYIALPIVLLPFLLSTHRKKGINHLVLAFTRKLERFFSRDRLPEADMLRCLWFVSSSLYACLCVCDSWGPMRTL